MILEQRDGKIFIDGKEILKPPTKRKFTNVSCIGGKIYWNGFEYADGTWKRTLKAIWHDIF